MSKKLYVGNLAYETTEATLAPLFEAIGEVVSVNLITDRMTGRSRGFAFVEMAEVDAAQQAINELNGKALDGRDIKVAEARPKRPREGGRGRY
jgi:cold-inducible RNA-binding protein